MNDTNECQMSHQNCLTFFDLICRRVESIAPDRKILWSNGGWVVHLYLHLKYGRVTCTWLLRNLSNYGPKWWVYTFTISASCTAFGGMKLLKQWRQRWPTSVDRGHDEKFIWFQPPHSGMDAKHCEHYLLWYFRSFKVVKLSVEVATQLVIDLKSR